MGLPSWRVRGGVGNILVTRGAQHEPGIGTTLQPGSLACHFACLWGQVCAQVKTDRGAGGHEEPSIIREGDNSSRSRA